MTRWPVISFAYIFEKNVTGNLFGEIRTKKHTHIGTVDLLVPFIYMKHVVKKSCAVVLFH